MSDEVKELIEIIEEIAPKELMESWDNTGMQIHTGKERIERILVCLDVNRRTVEEAVEKKCDFIVSHHPMFFDSFKSISVETLQGKYAVSLIENGISVYAAHTSFDACPGGNNDFLAELLELVQIETPQHEPILRAGFLKEPMKMKDFCAFAGKRLGGIQPVLYAGDGEKLIRKAAVCTGAGGSLFMAAKSLDCDLFVTGDMKYHEALTAEEMGMNIMDLGHFGTEIFFNQNMGDRLEEILSGRAEIIRAISEKNAIQVYFSDKM